MKSLRRFIDRRASYSLSAFALLLAMVAPGLVPAFAHADQVTDRSITLSNAAPKATGVTYDVKFTAVNSADSFAIEFCHESPIVGATCTAPTGFDASAAAISSGATILSGGTANLIKVAKTITAGSVDTVITGITNPDDAGALYARIVTYTNALATGGTEDQGGVAIGIVDSIGVQAAVLETMTFCVSAATLTADCAGATTPNLTLGEVSGSVTALDSTHLSEGTIHSQISTNAASGAVVNIKSNAAGCGGLKRAGAPSACDIAPGGSTGFSGAGVAKFGLKLGTVTDTGSSASGQLDTASGYDAIAFKLNYNSTDESTGVTSTYGDELYNTHDEPANNKNMPITFGASVSNTTPAGTYSANLSLIASGKY